MASAALRAAGKIVANHTAATTRISSQGETVSLTVLF